MPATANRAKKEELKERQRPPSSCGDRRNGLARWCSVPKKCSASLRQQLAHEVPFGKRNLLQFAAAGSPSLTCARLEENGDFRPPGPMNSRHFCSGSRQNGV